MRTAHIILGSIWWTLAYLPITLWYTWRREGIREDKDENTWYHWTWNFMWMSHYFVYQLPAIIFPFTFFGSLSVNQFYILVNYWIGLFGGGIIAAITTVAFIITLATHTDTSNAGRGIIAIELITYLTFTVGLAVFSSFFLEPKAYEYLELSLPKNQRGYDGKSGNPEGSENQPIGFVAL